MDRSYYIEEMDKISKLPFRPDNMTKLPENHVVDEEKSVKWNREFVINNNKEYQEKVNALRNYKNDLYSDLTTALIQEFMEEYDFNEAQSNKLYEKAYEDSHGEGIGAVIDTLEELAHFIEEIVELEMKIIKTVQSVVFN